MTDNPETASEAARIALDQALHDNAHTVTDLLSHPDARPRSAIVLWVCDPNDEFSRQLARTVYGPNLAAYEGDVRRIANKRGIRPLFFLGLKRDFAITHAKSIPSAELEASLSMTLTEPDAIWVVLNIDGFIHCKDMVFKPMSKGGAA